jgi:hypothetical protein
MRKLIASFCALTFASLTTDAVAQQWREYRPVAARFSVEMPGKPDIQTSTVPEVGLLSQAVVEFGEGWFSASHVDLPPDKTKNANANSTLDGARDLIMAWLLSRSDKAQLRSERRFITGGYPARHLVADVPILGTDFIFVARVVFNGRQMIVVSFVGPAESEVEPNTSRFFDSLKIFPQ